VVTVERGAVAPAAALEHLPAASSMALDLAPGDEPLADPVITALLRQTAAPDNRSTRNGANHATT
jgi:hypothetical protein